MVRKAKEWLREVSSILVSISLKRKLKDLVGTQSDLIKSLVRRNIEDKEENTNDIQHGPTA
tara:strand:- start:10 stop:192 length:183 start_codon:yes stop_codon:yes gene_type:complete